MAELYNIDNISYCPARQPEWFSKALFGGKLIEGGYLAVLPNVKTSTMLNLLDLNGATLLQKETAYCSWNPEQYVDLDEKEVKVTTYNIQAEDCVDKFEATYLVEKMKAGANQDQLPATLGEYTLDLIGTKVNKELETMIFGGDSTNPNEFDGIVKQLDASTDAIKIAGSTLTIANIAGEIQKTFLAIPEDVYEKYGVDGIKIFISYNSFRNLVVALTAMDSEVIKQGFTFTGEGNQMRIWYLGVEIVPTFGITNAQMVAGAFPTNFVLVTDLVSDFSEIELGNYPKPNNHKIWINGRLKLGVAVVHESEAVLYTD